MTALFEAGAVVSVSLTLLLAIHSVAARRYKGLPVNGRTADGDNGRTPWVSMRLLFWSALVLLWLSLIGGLAATALSHAIGVPPPMWLIAIGSLVGVALIAGAQFLRHLVWMPGGLMVASNLDVSRFYPLWRRLGVSRMRWLVLAGMLVLIIPVLWWIGALFAADDTLTAVQVTMLAALLAMPAIWEAMPEQVRTRRNSNCDANRPPNVLMIGCSSLGADALGSSGNSGGFTPFLDALVLRGSAFSRCYTPIAQTAPSVASWLTGRWPERANLNGHLDCSAANAAWPSTLATMLASAGYETAWIGDWSAKDLRLCSTGFGDIDLPKEQKRTEQLVQQGSATIRGFLTLFTHSKFGRTFLPELYFLPGIPVSHDLIPRALQKLEELHAGGRPWLLNLFLGTAHPPFASRYPYYAIYSDGDQGQPCFALAEHEDTSSARSPGYAFRDGRELDQVRALYGGCVRAFDDQVRQIVQFLQATDVAANTIVVIYGDYGTGLFERSREGSLGSDDGDGRNRVPLIILDPRFPSGRVSDDVVRTVDLLPTLLELCDAEVPQGLDGLSLAPYVKRGASVEARTAFYESERWLIEPPDWAGSDRRELAVIDGAWKLVYSPGVDGERYALYHLNGRPEPSGDLSLQHPDRCAALREKLNDWLGDGQGLSTRAPRG